MKRRKRVYMFGVCALLVLVTTGMASGQQQQKTRSIPRFEIDPEKYNLTGAEKLKQALPDSAKADSLQADSSATIDSSATTLSLPSRRRRFADVQRPSLKSPQDSSTQQHMPAGSDLVVVGREGLSGSAAGEQGSRPVATEALADRRTDSDSVFSDESVRDTTYYIPWEAIAANSTHDRAGADEDSTTAPAGSAPSSHEKTAVLFKPGVLLGAQIGLAAAAGVLALLFLTPSLRMRLYFLTGSYRKAIPLCEKHTGKNQHDKTMQNMLAFACFSSNAEHEKAMRAYERAVALDAPPERQSVEMI